MTGPQVPPSFRLAYVPGVTPTKWVRVWEERLPDVPLTLVPVSAADAAGLLREGGADAGLVRLPIDRDGLHAIPLYEETTVVVAPKDHVVAAVDEVTGEDLAGEIVLHPLDDTLDWAGPPGLPAIERPRTTEDAIVLVAAGIGLLVVPQSLARLHHRKDLTYRPLVDAPESGVALSWPIAEENSDLVEEFIGIVRGRTVNSSRGRAANQAPAAQPQSKKKPDAGGKAAPGKRAGAGTGGAKGAKGGKRGKPRRRS